MKRVLHILIFVTLPCLLNAQEEIINHSKIIIKIAPLSLIDIFGNTACLLSLEMRSGHQFSLSIDGGFFYHSLGYGLKNHRGWRSGIELRRYSKKYPQVFTAINTTYKKQQYSFTETIRPAGFGNTYEKVNVYTKQVATINFLYGIQKRSKNQRFILDGYFGLGLRYKNTSSLGLSPPEQKRRLYGDSKALEAINRLGKHYLVNGVFGLKLGWVLK